jgi:hypothetical protein
MKKNSDFENLENSEQPAVWTLLVQDVAIFILTVMYL